MRKNRLSEYRKMAAMAGKVWKKHGALQYFECAGDDLKPNMGGVKLTTFPRMAKARPGETVFFSFIVYRSKAHRDSVNKKVMKEFEKDKGKHKDEKMPFDVKRVAYGGFKTVVRE